MLELARRAAGLPGFLRRPLAPEAAAAVVAARVRRRGAAFLEVAERLIYGRPASPAARLLRWAGCEAGDLRRMVEADGLEAALEQLHAAGVRVSADELRGRRPLRRNGLEMHLAPRDFASPAVRGVLRGASSGTTAGTPGRAGGEGGMGGGAGAVGEGGAGRAAGGGLPVRYGWGLLEAEAAHERLLLDSHGLGAAPLALWMPGPPGIAGLHNALVHAKLGRPPERWFSPSPPPARGGGVARWADRGFRAARRLLPGLGPAAEWVPLERAVEVARWLAAAAPRPALLKCFASAAVRVAAAVRDEGLEMEGAGAVVFAGGEPLTAARQRALAAAGLRVFARYAATETGFLAAACPCAEEGGDMHLYGGLVAAINGQPDGRPGPLAFTSLTLAAPLVLLNVELGDHGTLRSQPCACDMGRAGLDRRVAAVHSPEKIAAEGVKLGEVDFARLVDEAVRGLGGGADDFQIWVGEEADGAVRPAVVLAPHCAVEPAALRGRLRESLPGLPGGGALAAQLWLAGGGLRVVRRPLAPGAGHKMRRVVRRALAGEGENESEPDGG